MKGSLFCAQQNRRRAFTLVELIVALALFVVVAGSVVSFILFINRYSDNSEEQTDRMYALASVRSETDYWFSYFDRPDFDVTVAADGSAVTASASGESYSISLVSDGDTNILLFTYPQELGRGTGNESDNRCEMRVDVSPFTGVRFYAAGSAESASASKLRFTVEMRVTQKLFACEIYEGEVAA